LPQEFGFHVRPGLLLGLVLICGLAGPLCATAARGDGLVRGRDIIVSADQAASAGSIFCVHVITTQGEKGLAVTVTLDGQPLPGVVISRNPDGSLTICVPVPPGTGGSTLEVTVSGGGSVGSASFPVQ
jgi:mRNA-degrading endonuclease toxin of MazEF toxin-antitoxin module